MEELLKAIDDLKKSGVRKEIDERVREFEAVGRGSDADIFGELSFCLLTAHYSAEGGIKIQDSVGSGFLEMTEDELRKKLREHGHRFPDARAKYIVEARKGRHKLKKVMESVKDEAKLREWVADNVKGLGNKESSHFLRNIGYKNLAILDFHIIDLLVRYGLIERPKSLTRKKYIEIEGLLKRIAGRAGLSLAELDLYLWYMETGKVLK
jgi:N-glycosylase/DNA lyase